MLVYVQNIYLFFTKNEVFCEYTCWMRLLGYYIVFTKLNNKYNFSEVVYDIDKHNIKVYNDGKYIKMVEMEQ